MWFDFICAALFVGVGYCLIALLVVILFDIKVTLRDHHKEFYETFKRETEMTSDEILDLMNETKKSGRMKKATKLFKAKR